MVFNFLSRDPACAPSCAEDVARPFSYRCGGFTDAEAAVVVVR